MAGLRLRFMRSEWTAAAIGIWALGHTACVLEAYTAKPADGAGGAIPSGGGAAAGGGGAAPGGTGGHGGAPGGSGGDGAGGRGGGCGLPPCDAFAQAELPDGEIIVEAEHYHSTDGLMNEWRCEGDIDGASGELYMVTDNDGVATEDTGESIDGTFALMRYMLDFRTGGLHRMRIRYYRTANSGGSDSIWFGVGSAALTNVGGMDTDPPDQWQWTNNAEFSVPSPGMHTFTVWMREDGTRLDRFVIQPSDATTGQSGMGPPESGCAR